MVHLYCFPVTIPEAKVGAKALMGALNHRDDDTKQLADLIYKVANILTNKQTNI